MSAMLLTEVSCCCFRWEVRKLADTIQFNTDSLKQLSTGFSEDITKLIKLSKNLDTNVTELHATWEGSSKLFFEEQYTHLAEDLQNMIKALEKYQDLLENAEKKYRKCENEVSDYIKKW